MKKLSPRRIAWFVRRARRQLMRVKARHRKQVSRSLAAATAERVVVYQHGRRRRVPLDGERKQVPKDLHLNSNWDATARFLKEVKEGLDIGIKEQKAPTQNGPPRERRRRWVRGARMGSFWDFSSVERITVPVALMLASQYDRSQLLSDWAPYAVDIDNWSADVRGMLRAIGFLDLAGVEDARTDVVEVGALRLLRMQRGQFTDGEAVAEYLTKLGIDVFSYDPRLMDAIMEAVTNCVHHAYKDMAACELFTVASWWLQAAVEETKAGQRLRIIVYDQGASIPRTLPSWERFPLVQRQLEKLWQKIALEKIEGAPDNDRFDGDAIGIALDVGRSSTAEQNRGKGLDQIVRALDLCESGAVHIHSRRGSFSRVRKADGTTQQSFNRSVPIIGTVVYWDLMINAVNQ